MTRRKRAPTIFISHASADAALATAVEEALRDVLGDRADIFSSSGDDAIRAGEDWLEKLESRLSVATAVVVILTAVSLERSWVWFEIGTVWPRWRTAKCRIYPLCRADMKGLELPSPLDRLQVRRISDDNSFTTFLKEIASQFGVVTLPRQRRKGIAMMMRPDPDHMAIGPTPASLKYAWKFISGYRSPRITDQDGEPLDI
jgi:hypothetical protein